MPAELGLREGQVAELVEHDKIHAGEISASRPCRLARASFSKRLTGDVPVEYEEFAA